MWLADVSEWSVSLNISQFTTLDFIARNSAAARSFFLLLHLKQLLSLVLIREWIGMSLKEKLNWNPSKQSFIIHLLLEMLLCVWWRVLLACGQISRCTRRTAVTAAADVMLTIPLFELIQGVNWMLSLFSWCGKCLLFCNVIGNSWKYPMQY